MGSKIHLWDVKSQKNEQSNRGVTFEKASKMNVVLKTEQNY